MSRFLSPISLAFLVVLATAQPASTVVPDGFSDVVVFATNSVRLNSDVVVSSGDVVANDVSPGPTLAGGGDFELYIDRKASLTGSARANRIKILNQATVAGTVFYGQALDNGGTIGGQSPGLAFPVFAPLPLFFTGSSDGPDVSIPAGGSQNLAPGTWGDITIDDGGSLVLSGGVYNVRSIDGMNDVQILFQGSAEVRVADKIRTRRRPTIGPLAGTTVGASDIVLYVAGINGTDGALGSTPEAARIGSDGVVAANFYVPNGTLRLEVNTVAAGAFLARDVQADRGSHLSLDSYFFNRPPVAVDDAAVVDEGFAVTVDVLANDSDPNQDSLTVTQILAVVNGGAVINADDTVTYAHDGSETTTGSFTYEVCDDGVEPGPLCATASVVIVVNPVNDPPVANDDSATTDEDTEVTIPVLANDTDVDGTLVPGSVTVTSGPANGTSVVDPGTGAITYSPAANFNGSDSLVYQACDDGFPLPSLCDSATVTITVNAVNDPPVANDDSATTDEDTEVTIPVLGNDTDIDGNLVPGSVLVTGNPTSGTTAVNPASGAITYSPDPDFNGSDSFVYQITDDGTGSPGPRSASATVTITVNAVNDSPDAVDDLASTPEDTAVTVQVLANDSDVDGNLVPSSVTVVDATTVLGTTQVNPATGAITYTPALDFSGAESFAYEVCDDGSPTPSLCSTAAVTVTVGAVNDPPVADPQTVFTSGQAALVITLRGSDAENDTLTFSIEGGPLPLQLANGVLSNLTPIVPPQVDEIDPETGQSTGNKLQPPTTSAFVTYTPDSALDLADSFTFTVTDPSFGFGTATVDINDTGDPTPPPPAIGEVTARDVLHETLSGQIEKISLLADAPDGVALTFTVISLPQGNLIDSLGQAIESVPYLLAGDKLTYISSSTFVGQDVFAFEASGTVNGSLQISQASVTVNVAAPVPLAEDQELTTKRNTPLDITLTGNAGGTGSLTAGLRAGLGNKSLRGKILPGADVAGNVSDANGDGFGDGRDDLPGPAPILVAAGVDVNLGGSPKTWTLDGVTFDDGGTASGTFVFDGNSQTATDWNITTTDFSTFGAFTYTPANSSFSKLDWGDPQLSLQFQSTDGFGQFSNSRQLRITPLQQLTNDGGTIGINLDTAQNNSGSVECINCAPFRVITAGSLSAPAGSGIQGVARIQIEWDVSAALPADPANVDSATVTLSTTRGTVDSLETLFFVGAQTQDGLLAVSDFEAPIADLVALMPVPAGSLPGDEGTFTFDVTERFKNAIAQGVTVFSLQGRVDESLAGTGFQRGLQVHSTATGNLLDGKEPKLDLVVTGEPPAPLVIHILSLPLNGILVDKSTGLAVQVGDTFNELAELLYTPALDFTGFDTFEYRVSENLVSATGVITLFIDSNDNCVPTGREPGCAPGSP